jgi:putative endonuclease
MSGSKIALGKWGEELAAEYLGERGYTILGRNIRTPYGELDLVVSQTTPSGNATIFVEVKTRTSTNFGFPEAAVTPQKKQHLIAAAQFYISEHPEIQGDWRIDVIAIQKTETGTKPEIIRFENAVP